MLKHENQPRQISAIKPAVFRRLCVETEAVVLNQEYERSSRLQAAVC
ncbi:hypothetical protein NEIFL0001_1325 [Neisseria flavescens SK114]|nr:hypothetical protein NEIFL0001_1325 [Neisseria flavescens SK114]